MIRYRIVPHDLGAHLFSISCTIEHPAASGQIVSLPAWIPGSYMIREFAKHIVSLRAHTATHAVAVEKIDKSSWRCAAVHGALTLEYTVYAYDLSVRGAHLDTTHGFFNGTSVFLRVHGGEQLPCEVDIAPPPRSDRTWQVATAMTPAGAATHGFGLYRAQNYDELIDHPVEMGSFALTQFTAAGVPHELAITGNQRADIARVTRDLTTICAHHVRFFGAPAPMSRYLFLLTILGEGYGGLEHRASSALIASRENLPRVGQAEVSDGYREFLGLCSHEYFHTWHVKRIKPAAFMSYDLTRENYTRQLWAFEGITSYYDDLALVRTQLIGAESYLELVAQTITRVLRAPGRAHQSVAESSFDAWTKFYRQDENAPNAIVSYYAKGSLVALALDLLLRQETAGAKSLDDVMRALWREHGVTGVGVPESGVERLAQAVTGVDLSAFFAQAVYGTDDLPLAALLATVGVGLQLRAAESDSDKGGKPAASPRARATLGVRWHSSEARLAHVINDGPACVAGLAAGDQVVAIDGLKATRASVEKALENYAVGDTLVMHVFRRDELMQFSVTLAAAPLDTCVLTLLGDVEDTVRARRQAWLGSA